jgi:hypothetical protein
MIYPELHTKPLPLDRDQHRLLRLRFDRHDTERFATMHWCFVVGGEFGDACKEYPLLWVRAGQDDNGTPQAAPIAAFGLAKQSNLCIERGAWRTQHLPVLMRVYPFAMARSGDQWVVCYDASSPRFSLTEGQPLFAPDGQPSALALDIQQQLEQIERDVERTRQIGAELLRLDLLREMRFEVTLPDGKAHKVEGFLTVDDKRLAELPDADIVALQRNGALGLIHAHQVSLSNMRRLAQWHIERLGPSPAAPATVPPAQS